MIGKFCCRNLECMNEDFEELLARLDQRIRKRRLRIAFGALLTWLGLALLSFLILVYIESLLWLTPNWKKGLLIIEGIVMLVLLFVVVLPKVFRLFRVVTYEERRELAIYIGKNDTVLRDALLNSLELHLTNQDPFVTEVSRKYQGLLKSDNGYLYRNGALSVLG